MNAICKMHDQIQAPQIKKGVHTRKVNITKQIHQQPTINYHKDPAWFEEKNSTTTASKTSTNSKNQKIQQG